MPIGDYWGTLMNLQTSGWRPRGGVGVPASSHPALAHEGGSSRVVLFQVLGRKNGGDWLSEGGSGIQGGMWDLFVLLQTG